MLARALDHDGLAQLGREPDEPLAERQRHAADGFRVQALGGGQRQVTQIDAGQIHRADVGVEPLGDEIDDVSQRLVEVVGARDDLGDVSEKCHTIRNRLTPSATPPPSSRLAQGYRLRDGGGESSGGAAPGRSARRLRSASAGANGRAAGHRQRRKHLVLVLEAQPEREQDLALRVHAAVHALFDAVDRAQRDRALRASWAWVISRFSRSSRTRFSRIAFDPL